MLRSSNMGCSMTMTAMMLVCRDPPSSANAMIPERIAHAREIYAGGARTSGSMSICAAAKIKRTSPVLRFSECAPHRLGARFPAMLAPVVNADGEQTGAHMTYLRRDGGGKADLPKEFQRECRGVIHGGAIRLVEHDPGVELIALLKALRARPLLRADF